MILKMLLKFENAILETLVQRKLKIINVVRPTIRAVMKTGKKNLLILEIGVAEGINSKLIIENLPVRKLWLIDSYKPYYQDGRLFTHYSRMEKEARTRLGKFIKNNEVTFLKGRSQDKKIISLVPNNLDFVYVDGNHSYWAVKKDIENYYKKLKNGGIIGGHDFNIVDVSRAVYEFVSKHHLKLHTEDQDWWFRK